MLTKSPYSVIQRKESPIVQEGGLCVDWRKNLTDVLELSVEMQEVIAYVNKRTLEINTETNEWTRGGKQESLWSDLINNYNIDVCLPAIFKSEALEEEEQNIIYWIILAKQSWISDYKTIAALNNSSYNSLICEKLFWNIKKWVDEPWEKRLFTSLFDPENDWDLRNIRNFLKAINKGKASTVSLRKKNAERLQPIIEKIFFHLDYKMQVELKEYYQSFWLQLNRIQYTAL